MKLHVWFVMGLSLLLSILCVRGSWTDEDGVERMGDPPPGAKTAKDKNKSEFEVGRKWVTAPNHFDGPRFRVIDGKLYDFQTVISWGNEHVFLMTNAPSTKEPSKLGDWIERMEKNAEPSHKYGDYLVRGKVVQVLPDGIIVKCRGGSVDEQIVLKRDKQSDGSERVILANTKSTDSVRKFIKNHPGQKTLADGDVIDCLAMSTGQYRNTKVLGAKATIRGYDYGKAATESDASLPKGELVVQD